MFNCVGEITLCSLVGEITLCSIAVSLIAQRPQSSWTPPDVSGWHESAGDSGGDASRWGGSKDDLTGEAGQPRPRVGVGTSAGNGEHSVGASGKLRALGIVSPGFSTLAVEGGALLLRITAAVGEVGIGSTGGDEDPGLCSLEPRRRCRRRSATARLADSERRHGKIALGVMYLNTEAP